MGTVIHRSATTLKPLTGEVNNHSQLWRNLGSWCSLRPLDEHRQRPLYSKHQHSLMAGQCPRSRPGLRNLQIPIWSSIHETSLNKVQSVAVPSWIRPGSVPWSWPVVSGTRAMVADPLSSIGNEMGPKRCLTGSWAGQARSRPWALYHVPLAIPEMIIVIHFTCQGFCNVLADQCICHKEPWHILIHIATL